ncbi:DUF2628 domain-containing protein [Consotaella salsifontis]|uniref:DUF2628 domain-containing protein n=1 Tax=Consotaella salsifontis TaxID=1365950 RepID=A0A1T4SVA4_9HYPH|nr:DUF2628 domain-containing protein [Consotaella salsifontis]SKA32076.1 Protein of unknown function [Consotaella salsifontis]
MTRYIVFEPPGEEARSDRALFVRDGWSFWALLFPFLWLFRYGLVISGLLVLIMDILVGVVAARAGLETAGTLVSFIIGLLVALEGPSLRAWRLRRRGWREGASLVAHDLSGAEQLYYAGGRESTAPSPSPQANSPSSGGPRPAPAGLFD